MLISFNFTENMEDFEKYNIRAILNDELFFACELIKDVHQGVDFLCPHCGEVMHPAMGPKNMWHFRHLKSGDCEGGGESELHYFIKNWIGIKAKENGLDAILEKSVRDVNIHRPDVTIFLKEGDMKKYHCKGIAVEIQNSPILDEDYHDRNNTFLANGLTPWWIFCGKHFKRLKKELGRNIHETSGIIETVNKEFDKIVYFDNNRLIGVSYNDEFLNYKVNEITFLNEINYICGQQFQDLTFNILDYVSTRCGFYLWRNTTWLSYPQLIKFREKILDKKIGEMHRELKIIRKKLRNVNNKIKNINNRLDDIIYHYSNYGQEISKTVILINVSKEMKYDEFNKALLDMKLKSKAIKNIEDFLLKMNYIIIEDNYVYESNYYNEIKTQDYEPDIDYESGTYNEIQKKEKNEREKINIDYTESFYKIDELVNWMIYHQGVPFERLHIWFKNNYKNDIKSYEVSSILKYLISKKVITKPSDDRFYYPQPR